MNPIADGSLGSQYWITTDLRRLSELYGPETGPEQPEAAGGTDVEPEKGVIGNDSVLTSLASGSESAKFTNVLGQAKMLAPLLAGEGQEREITTQAAVDRLAQLCPDETLDGLVEKIVRLSRRYVPDAQAADGGPQGDAKALAEKALKCILFSTDFAERARDGTGIGHDGKLALVNATLGLMKMASEGKVDLEQPGDCLFGEFTDLSKPVDVLRLAVRTARAAREKFVDEEGLRNLLEQATQSVGQRNPADSRGFAAELEGLVNTLIDLRKGASQRLDLTMDLGNDLSKRKIESRLKEARESMRAFRYDLDRASGRPMGFMERLRRRADDLFSSRQNRMTAEQYGKIRSCEEKIGQLLEKYGFGDRKGAASLSGVNERAKLATEMTHATNNHIRYYFSGAESRREKFAAAAHEMFDPMVEHGGSKTVSFEVGADVRAGLEVGEDVGVGLDVRTGAKYVRTATVSVPPGGGEVTVTYYDGGAVEGSVEGDVGVGEWGGKDTGKPKVGANFSGKGELGGGVGRTVTYPSLDAFIADCNGESSLVSVGKANNFLCLGKIYQGCRALMRGARDLMAKIGLLIHKSVVDSGSYRALLQRNGVMRKVDVILSNAPRHVMKTSEKKYGVVKGGFEVGGGMSVEMFRGIDEKTDEETTASLLELGGSLSYSGERQLHVRGQEMRARIDTLRQESGDMLAERLDEAWVQNDTEDLVTGIKQDIAAGGDRLHRLSERLISLENEAAGCGDDREAWRRICRRLEVLTVRYVQVERELEDDARAEKLADDGSTVAQKRLEEAQAFFAERLSNPQMSIPEDVFREELVDMTGEIRAGKSVHKVSFKVEYDVGTDFVTDVAKSSPEALQPEKTEVDGETVVKDLHYGQQVAQTLISDSIGTAMGELGLSGSMELAMTVEKPTARDVRPWKNDKTVLLDVKLEPNLPVRVLVEKIASKYVDSLTDEGRPEDADGVLEAVKADLIESLGLDMGMDLLSTAYADLTIQKVVDASAGKGAATEAQEFFAGPLFKSVMDEVPLQGLEAGVETDCDKTIQFRFEHGKLACMSVSEGERTESTLGVRFKTGPVGVGVHMKTGYAQSDVERSIYRNPHVDTLLGRTSEFLRGGTRGQLSLFLAHNKVGALRVFDAATQADGVVRERIGGAKKLLNGILEQRVANSTSQKDRSLVDRAQRLKTMLASAETAVGACDGQATEAEKLKALEDLLVALVRAFDLAKEGGMPPA